MTSVAIARFWANDNGFLRGKPFRQFTPADFATLIGRDCVDNKNSLRHLPGALTSPAKFQKCAFTETSPEPSRRIDISAHTRRNLFISQSSASRATERHCLAKPGKAQQHFLNLGRVHFFTRDVDHVRNAPYDLQTVAFAREQVVGNENPVAQFLRISFRKITVAGGSASNANLT